MCIDKIIKENNYFHDETEWLKQNSPFYPDVLIKETSDEVIASSIIRKEHEGKWYLWHLIQRVVRNIDDPDFLMKRIMINAYRIIVLGKVDLKCTNLSGEPMFELDPDQTPERERLTQTLFPNP